MKKDLQDLLDEARAEGATVTFTHGGHWKVVYPGAGIAFLPSTPSGGIRGHKNARSVLRRAKSRRQGTVSARPTLGLE
jgi:hypothetical protein